MRNIYKYLWYKIIRNTDPMGRPPKAAAPLGRRRRRRLCFWIFYIINLYGYSLYIPYIFPSYVPSISLVCFLIYGVKSKSGHDWSQSFGPILHGLDPKLSFFDEVSRWFCMVLRGGAEKYGLLIKTLYLIKERTSTRHFSKNEKFS